MNNDSSIVLGDIYRWNANASIAIIAEMNRQDRQPNKPLRQTGYEYYL